MLYLSETAALPVGSARPPPAETTRCVDRQITDHLTFAGGERADLTDRAAAYGMRNAKNTAGTVQSSAKKRLSLAARHRFFGQGPKKWGRKGNPRSKSRETQRRTRANAKQGGNPLIGFPPWTPLLIFNKQKGDFARCGGRPGAPPLDPAAFEKAGETFKRARCAQN